MRPLLSPRHDDPCCLCSPYVVPVYPVPVPVPSLVLPSLWLSSPVSPSLSSAFHCQPGHRCPSSVHIPDAVRSTSLLSPLSSIAPVVHPASSRGGRTCRPWALGVGVLVMMVGGVVFVIVVSLSLSLVVTVSCPWSLETVQVTGYRLKHKRGCPKHGANTL
jgi:hypothetical protein